MNAKILDVPDAYSLYVWHINVRTWHSQQNAGGIGQLVADTATHNVCTHTHISAVGVHRGQTSVFANTRPTYSVHVVSGRGACFTVAMGLATGGEGGKARA